MGEVGVAGQVLWLKAKASTVAIRFSDTYKETEGHEGKDLPEACLVLNGGVMQLDYPPPLPKFRRPRQELAYGWPDVTWRAASDELRVISEGVTLTYRGGTWK